MEDYWVLKALMQIIDRTNVDEVGKPVTRRDMASIREIHSIKIGKNAADRVGNVYKLAPVAADGQQPVPPAGVTPTPTPVPPLGGPLSEGAGPLPAADATSDPAERRYVDIAYQPLPAEKLRKDAESDNPDEAYLAVAKRMPVRLDVRIDQRKLNKFLIECGNSDLMLEVIQVRTIPPQDVFALAGGQRGSGGQGAGGGGQDVNRGDVTDDDRKAHIWDVDVQVYGIIYIFNPPSLKRLTNGLAEDKVKEFEAWAEKEAKSLAAQDEALDALNVPSADPPAGGETTPAADADKNRPAEPPAETEKDPPAEKPAEPAKAAAVSKPVGAGRSGS
jgi:hypothetical protein